MAYYFMLGVVPLPIPPSALEIKTPSMNKTVTLINDGEINIPKYAGLREISFDFLLPTIQKYPFANYQLGNFTAATLILYLNGWKDAKIPIPFIVVRMSPKGKFLYFTSILCLIEDFTYKEDAEEYGFDTMCSITLKEYRPYGTKRVKLEKPSSAKPASTQKATVEKTRDSSGKKQPSKITTKKNETVVTGAKKTGDNLAVVLSDNDLKIPDAVEFPTPSQETWTDVILPEGDFVKVSESMKTDDTMERISSYQEYLGGKADPWDQGRPKLESLADSVLKAPTKNTYARPTPPPNYGTPALGNGFSEFIKLNKVLMGL